MTPSRHSVFAALILTGLAAGCSSNVIMQDATIPVPLTSKIPITVGLRMPEDFYSYVHEEQVYGRDEWSIDLGDSNAAFFRQLFGHMFDTVTLLKVDDDPKNMDIDALIEPSIDAFEFSVPAQSNTEAFAVWVRYRLKVYDREGKLVSNWPVSAYGKSQTSSLSNSEALQRAAILAMRDAAALIIMKLDTATGLSAISTEDLDDEAPAADPTPLGGSRESDVQATAIEGSFNDAS